MPANHLIRPERPEDIEAVATITELAFRTTPHSQQTEQFIIAELRRAGALAISLVAEVEGQVVGGHVAFSLVEFSDGSRDWYTLGPVTPARQGQGIGQALVRAGLEALRGLGAGGCVLVGEPEYYKRFGFASRPDCAMDGVPQEYILSLTLGGLAAKGVVTIHEAFRARG